MCGNLKEQGEWRLWSLTFSRGLKLVSVLTRPGVGLFPSSGVLIAMAGVASVNTKRENEGYD